MKPKIPLYFTVVRKHGSLYFICGDKIVEVHGKSVGLLEKLLPFLDGKHDFEEILGLTKYPKERVKSIIRFLSDNSIVFDDDNVNHFKLSQNDINANTLKTLYFASIGNYSKMYEPTKRLKNSSVFLVGLGAVGSRVASSLALNGVGKLFASDSKEVGPADIELGPYTNRDAGTQRGEALRSIVPYKTELHWVKADLSDKQFLDCLSLVDLVICCSENRSLLYRSSLNRMCVTQGKPWLNTAVYEDHGEVGPTVIPYMSPCFDCYYLRIKSNIDDIELYTAYQEQLMSDEKQLGLISPFADIIAGLTTSEALKYLGKYSDPATLSGVLHVDFKTYSLSVDRLLKVPNCPTCGKRKEADF